MVIIIEKFSHQIDTGLDEPLEKETPSGFARRINGAKS